MRVEVYYLYLDSCYDVGNFDIVFCCNCMWKVFEIFLYFFWMSFWSLYVKYLDFFFLEFLSDFLLKVDDF